MATATTPKTATAIQLTHPWRRKAGMFPPVAMLVEIGRRTSMQEADVAEAIRRNVRHRRPPDIHAITAFAVNTPVEMPSLGQHRIWIRKIATH
ncbi:MAG: hypothetical protein ABW022_24335 [Actinoplanes sp.]